MNNLKNIGRYMSLLLRHKPEKENLILDKNGYVLVSDLLQKLEITKEDLDWIVKSNDKKRFTFNDDESKIRAAQGHSIDVDLTLKTILPPTILFHGTTIDNKKSILKDGLKSMNRNHVHLTSDKRVANAVGMRYAKYFNKLWIIKINAKQMNKDGYKFSMSENGVYLINKVPSKYFI